MTYCLELLFSPDPLVACLRLAGTAENRPQHNSMCRLSTLLAVACVLVGAASASPTGEVPCTTVNQGAVCGNVMQSRGGRKFAAFRGIPYAKSPVGDLRFKDPVPAENWNGTFDATKDAPSCVQKNYLIANPFVEGQEDCLYINVYTPKILSLNENVKTPYHVMVYIHGGGWFSGAGNSSLHGPEYIMDENVVLVSFNYRLGVFGFLSTSDDEASGNWAFKDMTLALKWVKDNIKYFGGQAESVTIFGQSAGGSSVHYLMLSPQTEGLFHKAISQSGSALNLFATPIDSIIVARAQALFVGCPANGTTVEIVNCLRKLDANLLVESGDKFKFWSIDPLTVYIPTVEKKTAKNPNPFLSDLPLNLISKGQFHRVPYIMGVMENEGIIRVASITSQSKLREDLNAKWNDLGPQLFGIAQSIPKNLSLVPALWENLTEFYMGDQRSINQNDPTNVQNFLNFYSDRSFVYGIYQSATKHVKLGLQPMYFYKINYAGRDSWSSSFAGNVDTHINFVFNKSHCDDLNYLFRIPDFFPEPFPKDSPDYELSKNMVKMWTTFAREGKPAKCWEQLSADKFQYLEITGPANMTMRTDFFPERMKFWESQQIEENR